MAVIVAGLCIALTSAGGWVAVPDAVASQDDCLVASGAFNDRFGIGSAVAVRRDVAKQESGLGDEGVVWFVSTADGATWVTEIDPVGSDRSGLFLPLNEKARKASEVGSEATLGAPIYRGFNDTSEGAVASRACASTTTSPTVPVITMPNVVGENAAVAEDRLKSLGFKRIEFGSGDASRGLVLVPANWTVLKQSPAAGAKVPAETLVVLTCTKE